MRKTSMWRLVAALFALVLVAAACGDSDGGDADSAADTETETEVTLAQSDESLLDTVQARGTVNCGIPTSAVAFATQDANGNWVGFDVDYCKAVAAAVLGDADLVTYVPLTAAERFTAIQVGDADLLMRTTTWTQGRDASGDQAMDFGPTTYFDGQQLMGRSSDGFSNSSTVADIGGTSVCTNAGTTTEKNVSDAAKSAGVEFTLITVEDFPAAMEGFIAGTCDIVTTDGSGLVGEAATQEANADGDWVIFPPAPISKEPLGPVYPQNDSKWGDVINWVVFASIIADEQGITAANAQAMFDEQDALFQAGGEGLNAEVYRLLGGDGELQTALGLDPSAFLWSISAVGNYDEIYTRNLVPVGLTRTGSANARWTEGGLVYAPPAR
ncbi:MAG: transporter substrate-binding domain-containing protein [Acidimicrobiales bacterium]